MNKSGDLDDAAEPGFDDKYTQTLRYVITAIQCFMILLTLAGNFATMAAFYKVRSLREKPGDLYILNLSCADFFTGVFFLPMVPVHATGNWPWGKTMCQVFVCFVNAFVCAGIVSTVAISLDRYFLISREYPKYVKFQSTRRVYRTIAAIWVYSFGWTVFEWIMWEIVKIPEEIEDFDYTQECRSPPKHLPMYSTVAFIISVFIPLISIEVLSIAFVILLRRKLKRRAQVTDFEISNLPSNTDQLSRISQVDRKINTDGGQASGNMVRNAEQLGRPTNNGKNRYVKAAITLAALVATLNFCLMPYIIYNFYVTLICPACNNGRMRTILANLFVNFNSCLNPVLYALTMSKIRRFYKRILCSK